MECHQSCTRDPLCSVWQYDYMTQCWQGVGRGCVQGGPEWESRDYLAIGAQRLQHGDIHVLQDLRGWEVAGLHDLGDSSAGTGNHTLGATSCRAWCYSNIRCQYWQYAPGTCRVEDPDRSYSASYPLGSGARRGSEFAAATLAGEFIRHICPAPQVAHAEALPGGAAGGTGAGLPPDLGWWLDAAFAASLIFAFAKLWARMRGYGSVCGFLPSWHKTFTLLQVEDEGIRSMEAEHPKLTRWNTPLVPTPVVTFFRPGQLDQIVHGHFATAAERQEVAEVAPEAPRSLANYLAWRRTFAGALLLLGTVSSLMQWRVLFSTWRHHVYFVQVGEEPQMQSYKAWVAGNPADPSFWEYSKDKAMTLLAAVLGEVLRGAFHIDLAVCGLEAGSLLMLAFAMRRWTSFAHSRRLVLRAWFASFVAAFAVSLFPVRLTLSFSPVERQADMYVHELAVAMNLDKAQQLLMGGCQEIAEAGFTARVETVGNTLRKTCRNLSRFPIQLAVPCIDSINLCHIDLAKAVDGCHEAVQQFDMGHVGKAAEIVQRQCVGIKEAFSAPDAAVERQAKQSQAFEVLVDMLRMPFHVVVPSVEAVALTVSALHAIVMVLPPALSIAPGLMAAGFATKVLAPHSELPGAVIIIVPILQASFGWLAHTILFQYVSHPWVLTLLAVMVTYPLVYIWIGMRYRVTMPVHHTTLQRAARASTMAVVLMGLFGAAVVYRMAQDFAPPAPGQLMGLSRLLEWCHVSWARLALACSIRTLYAFALTFFGASDWMISDISVQLRYWQHWGGVRNPDVSMSDDDEEMPRRGTRLYKPFDVSSSSLMSRSAGSATDESVEDTSEDRLNEDLAELLRHRLLRKANSAAAARRPAANSVSSLCSDETSSTASTRTAAKPGFLPRGLGPLAAAVAAAKGAAAKGRAAAAMAGGVASAKSGGGVV